MNLRKRDENGVIKIAVIEMFSNGKEDAIKPFEMQPHFKYDSWTNHADNVIKVIRSFVPNAEIHLVPNRSHGLQYVIDNDFAIVNMSLTGSMARNLEKEMSEHSFLVTSAGNDGDDGESWSARQEFWCAVGAVDLNLQPKYYSAWGHGAVRTCAITPTVEGRVLQGTSFTGPVVTGLLAQWYCWYEREMKCYPSVQQTYDFIKENSHDIFEDGTDYRTGYGLLRLPQKFIAFETVVKVKNRIANQLIHIEGQEPEERAVDLLAEPEYKNQRTMVPSNGLTSSLAINVRWDQPTQTSRYIKSGGHYEY